MLLRYLKRIELYKANQVKQSNGTYIDEYALINNYKVQKQDLSADEIASTIYGADINKMLRIKSVKGDLERYLLPKVSNKSDNISKYYIFDNEIQYRIKAVTESRIDLERI